MLNDDEIDQPGPESELTDKEVGPEAEEYELDYDLAKNGKTPDTVPIVLTDEQRVAYLGKMVDFQTRMLEISAKQQAFVLAVLEDPSNYTKAAAKAGYAWPNVAASKLLASGPVAACIAAGEQLREDRTMITSERTLHEYAIIAFSDISNYSIDKFGNVKTKEGVPKYVTRAIQALEIDRTEWKEDDGNGNMVDMSRVKVKFKLWNKNDALKMLAMYQHLLAPDGGTTNNINIGEIHQHNHETWMIGDKQVKF